MFFGGFHTIGRWQKSGYTHPGPWYLDSVGEVRSMHSELLQDRVDISWMGGIYFTPSIVSRAHHSGHMTGTPYGKWNPWMHTYIMLHQKMNAQETLFLAFLSDSKHVYDSKIKKLYSSCKGGGSWFIYLGFKLYTVRERRFLLLMIKLLIIHLMNIICTI